MALLMAVRLIRSSQVLASFRRTHVLKLSLPRQLHMLFPSHSTHSQAAFLIIMQHKRLARTKLFVTRWHCNDPKKGMTNGQCIAMHCSFGTDKKAIGGSQGYKFSSELSFNVFYQLIGCHWFARTNVAWVGKPGTLGGEPQIKAVFILGRLRGRFIFYFRAACNP